MTNTNIQPDPETFVAWVGFDWGDKEHAFVLRTPGQPAEKGTLPHSAETLHAWIKNLEQRFGGRPIALAIETTRGASVHVLAQYPWLTIYPINPLTSSRYRQAFVPSGAKDDLPDAAVLLDLVQYHSEKLRPLQWENDQTRLLSGLVQARRDLVNRRTQVVLQVISLLKTYYPQALILAGKNFDCAMGREFLRRWPDLISLKAARPATIKSFYYRHNVRRPELVERRLELISKAVALTTDEAIVHVAVVQLKCLVELLGTYAKHIQTLDQQIAEAFRSHPDSDLFNNLPGAGPALAPRLLVAFGTDRSQYPTPGNLQKYAGIAPVREKSGNALWTHWRWQAPVFLRQSFIEWAGQTVIWSEWAKTYYRSMKARGKKHNVILRALAFKWIRILWTCWKNRRPYDENVYLRQLTIRQSPYAPTSTLNRAA